VASTKAKTVAAGTGKLKEIKASNLSQARAGAAAPWLNNAMFDKIETMYADLYAKDILKTKEPLANQIYGGDEVGRNPTGAYASLPPRPCGASGAAHVRLASESTRAWRGALSARPLRAQARGTR
jgi:hypothetical protein